MLGALKEGVLATARGLSDRGVSAESIASGGLTFNRGNEHTEALANPINGSGAGTSCIGALKNWRRNSVGTCDASLVENVLWDVNMDNIAGVLIS